MTTTGSTHFAAWVHGHAVRLGTLDSSAPPDDLEPIRALIKDARVVAIGESAHYIREFYLLRHRLLRFLAERCRITVCAWEAPFTEAHAVAAWVQGGPGTVEEAAAAGIAIGMGRNREMHELLRWMREYNHDGKACLRFAGIDVPGCGGSPLPALREVGAYLSRADPGALPLLTTAIGIVRVYHDPHTFNAINRYAALDAATQDTLTAALSRLLARMDTMSAYHRARGRHREHLTALAHLRGAWHVDHLHRDITGRGIPAGSASRDAFMAETVLRLLGESGPDTRIMVAAHNCHIQKTPAAPGEGSGLFPMGYHLARALGGRYVAIAATGAGGRTARIEPAPDQPQGFRVHDRPVPAATAGSVETAFHGSAPALIADLKAARRRIGDAALFHRIRMEDYFSDTPVFGAFDAVACVRNTTCARDASAVDRQ